MGREREALELRNEVDGMLRKWLRVRAARTPRRGWIRCIREALQMSTGQFARRLGVSQCSIRKVEKSEINDTIQLATLRRAAKALNCRLVYALVPEKPLEQIITDRRRAIAGRDLDGLSLSAGLSREEWHNIAAAYGRKIRARRLWEAM